MNFCRQFAIIVLLIGLFGACSSNHSQDTSGATEGGNATLTGCILDSLGTPIQNARVQLRNQSYLVNLDSTSVDSLVKDLPSYDTYTDVSGFFSFQSVPFGAYFLESIAAIPSSADSSKPGKKKKGRGSGGSSSDPFVEPSKVLSSVVAIELHESGSLHVVDSLHIAGSISGTLEEYFIEDGYHYVKIQGLEHYATVDTGTGDFLLDDVPAGNYRLVFTGDAHSNGAYFDVSLDNGENVNLGEIRLTRF